MGRKQLLTSSLLSAMVVGSFGVSGALADSPLPVDRLIIKFKHSEAPMVVGQSQAETQISAQGRALGQARAMQRLEQAMGVSARPTRTLANGAVVMQMPESRLPHQWLDVMTQLAHDDDVLSVEPDLRAMPDADPLYSSQWHLTDALAGVNADEAWLYATGTGAVIAVVDSGIRPHQDLMSNTLPGYDFITDVFTANDGNGRDADPADAGDGVVAGACGGGEPQEDRYSSWHGTHVAGIAAAALNGVGGQGVAYDAQILPLRVLGRCGGYTSDIVDAIYWAAGYQVTGLPVNNHPADVINLSLSTTQAGACGTSYTDAINAAVNAGVTVVTSAGNLSDDAGDYSPGNCAGVISVAATNRNGSRATYSNFGSVVDLAAPGGVVTSSNDTNGIWSSVDSGQFAPEGDAYAAYQGTSMSAPQVSGAVALMRSMVPDAMPSDIEEALKDTTLDFFGSCNGCGTGLLDAEEAVKRILGLTVPDAVSDMGVTLAGDNGKFVDQGNGSGIIQYRVTVTNHGPDEARDLVVNTILPAAVEVDLLTPPAGVICNVTDFSCRWSSQASGESLTFTIRVSTTNKNKMDFAASVSTSDTDPNTGNNYATRRFGGSVGLGLVLMAGLLLRRKR